jgi:hypothetical protein
LLIIDVNTPWNEFDYIIKVRFGISKVNED